MKKMLFVVLAVSAGLLILSGIHAQDTPQPNEKPKVEEQETEKPSETPKVDPDKKYDIKFNFAKDMSFTRIETNTSQRIITLSDQNGEVKRIVPGEKSETIEMLKYSILDLMDNKISKFKIDITDYQQKMGQMYRVVNKFPSANIKPADHWVIVGKKSNDEVVAEKYSEYLNSLIDDESNLYEGMKSVEAVDRPSGVESKLKLLFDNTDMAKEFKPNTLCINKIISKLLYPDYSNASPISIGDSWEVTCAKFKKVKDGSIKIIDRMLTGFLGTYDSLTRNINFHFEKIENDDGCDFAILTLKDKFCNESTKHTKRDFLIDGKIIHNLTRNRIKSISVKVKMERETVSERFGKYKEEIESVRTFEYKYDE